MLKLSGADLARLRRALFKQLLCESPPGARPPAVREQGLLVEDPHGRPVLLKFNEQGFISGFQGHAGLWQLALDGQGLPTALIFPDGLRLGLAHDPHGRLARLSLADGQTVELGYDAAGHLSALAFPDQSRCQFQRDSDGRILARIDRLDNSERYHFDAQGNLREIVEAAGQHWQLDYQGWDRPARLRFPDQRQHHFDYDGQGRLRELASSVGDGAPQPLVLLHYSDAGTRLPDSVSFADGEELRFQHDARQRLREASGMGPTLAFQYDNAGRLLEEQWDGQWIRYQYGEHHCCTGMEVDDGSRLDVQYDRALRVETVEDGLGQHYRWRHGANADSLECQFPNGLVGQRQWRGGLMLADSLCGADGQPRLACRYRHDSQGFLQELVRDGRRWRYRYDRQGRLSALDDGNASHAFRHDPGGRILQQYGIPQRFDEAGRLIGHGQQLRLGYDARGRVEKLRRDDRQWRFHYNDRDLLLAAEATDQRLEFAYDPLGRRTLKRCQFPDQRPDYEIHYRWAGELLIQARLRHHDGETRRDFYYIPGTALPLAMVLDGVWYGCHLDHRGAPLALSDAAGQLCWRGEYRWFGACTSAGEPAPWLALPGVQHDPETGLHYDRFRYYEPELGWYLTPDPLGLLRGLCPYRHRGDGHLDARVRHWPVDAASAARLSPGAILVHTAPSPLLYAPPPAPLLLLQHFLGENLNAWLEQERLRADHGDPASGRQLFVGQRQSPRAPYASDSLIHRALAMLAAEPGRSWRHFTEF